MRGKRCMKNCVRRMSSLLHLGGRTPPPLFVDAHVLRTSRRLGLIGPKVSADAAHMLFAKVLPLEWIYPVHVNFITH